ncbi:MAG: murein biosynthesis integral membrane protein MurJ [Desulfitobacteriaceae bacterium]|nr:murein biosynthesis integral membrane protein MurJ [Desulfitobacteriaceae bacterium]MDD4753027.1 murein biosynthesis integral membrane protein MurJ [Desulfitobacteriaceae bacterium]
MTKSIAKAAGIVLMMNLASKVLGFVRETVIANKFGASGLTDAYLVAYTLPYFLQAILGFALVTTVVPVLTKYLVQEDYDEAWHVASTIINLTAAVLAVFTLFGMVAAAFLVKITAPGFTPELSQLATGLAQIMFPSVVFMGVGMVLTGILNASYKFAAPAFAPGFSNLIIIGTVIFFGYRYGITGLAVGTLISFFGFFLLQVPVLKSIKFKYSFSFDYRHPAVKQAAVSIGPIVLGVAVNQIYFALNRIFASGLAEGSISALNFANKLMTLPLGVFVAAVASAIYPALAAQAIKGDRKALKDTMLRGLGMVSLITVPAAVGLMVLREPIVRLLFEHGAFDREATLATAAALFYFSIGLFPGAANMIITRAYYAVEDVKTPVVVGAFSIIVNLVLSFALLPVMGHAGLALANSLAAGFNMIFLFFRLKKHLPGLKGRGLLVSLGKMCAASALMALLLGAASGFLGTIFNLDVRRELALMVFTAISAGALSYFVAVIVLRVEDVRYVQEAFWNRLRRKL